MVNSVRVYLSRGHFSGCVLRFVDEFPQNGQSACGGLDTVIVVFRLRRNNFASKSVYVYLRPGKLTTNVITTHFKHGWVPSIPKNIFLNGHRIKSNRAYWTTAVFSTGGGLFFCRPSLGRDSCLCLLSLRPAPGSACSINLKKKNPRRLDKYRSIGYINY